MIFDGKKLAQVILDNLKTEVSAWKNKPSLAVVSFGQKEDNSSYITQKRKTAEFLGLDFKHYHYSDSDLLASREYLNKIVKMKKHSAVVVQLPLAAGMNYSMLNIIPITKDPDLLSDKAVGLFFNGRSLVDPPTAAAVLRALDESGISIKGKRIVLFGYGRLIGRFLTPMLIKKEAVVTVLEKNIPQADVLDVCLKADIIISAVGKAGFITGSMIKKGAVIVDAGFSLLDGKIAGDVDFNSVKDKISFITPVPGGIGPVTVAELFSNVIKLFKIYNKK
ncbi:MAG: bifunctional 5,10-methylenetetrahydrofolate dehydrogenase/5,10-methenyltetrahydrofolate cyclohydrolase [Candidatus Sungbacteria bacterium]|uniref:Bifunctional protein FolD n=1 Tax=Candidatus Sungiibacteriota bacterium TaxID=2750080 RepID=A0A931YD67_9BACT|nr:bifunctional 5,10-methylenetetrahydrofolate dehydrogenase/5,10-methenyltetrahydrofolate cyclohydrolase [Candidatus Sungbacteria bacterium]MBI2465769.1 bifunctional 5,10-methylenetetrahydrofolate dehydrogenase/5,10-methenyltetrahydrofolate cyclohydrolase [Candidatus Sungbacteria bacterium]